VINFKKFLLTTALLLSFSSISQAQTTPPARVDYSSLKVGEASQQSTIDLLGKPLHIDKNPDGRSVYMYETAPDELTGFMFNKEGILAKIAVFKKNK